MSQNKPVMLFVDDQISDLEAVIFDLGRVYGNYYQIDKAASGDEALEAVAEYDRMGQELVVCISDIKMPGMNGVELLSKISASHPKSRRMILTAYADKQNAIQAINSVGLDSYLEKPWKKEELLLAVDRALEKYYALADSRLVIPHEKGEIIIKEAGNQYEREQAFGLSFRTYVEDMKIITKESKLAFLKEKESQGSIEDAEYKSMVAQVEDMWNKQQIWDEYDFRLSTRQIVAMQDGKCVGRVRLVDGDIPLRYTVPEQIEAEEAKGIVPREISKLMISPEMRNTSVLVGLFRMTRHHSLHLPSIYCSAFKFGKKLYEKIGFTSESEFTNNEFIRFQENVYLKLNMDKIRNYSNYPLDQTLMGLINLPIGQSLDKERTDQIPLALYRRLKRYEMQHPVITYRSVKNEQKK